MTVPKTNDRTKSEWQVRGRTWKRVGPNLIDFVNRGQSVPTFRPASIDEIISNLDSTVIRNYMINIWDAAVDGEQETYDEENAKLKDYLTKENIDKKQINKVMARLIEKFEDELDDMGVGLDKEGGVEETKGEMTGSGKSYYQHSYAKRFY